MGLGELGACLVDVGLGHEDFGVAAEGEVDDGGERYLRVGRRS